MTEQDDQAAYEALAKLLEEFHLGWVVAQVEAVVSAATAEPGEIIDDRTLSTRLEPPQALLTRPRPHHYQEKLLRLIDATQRLVVDTTEVEAQLGQFLAEGSQDSATPMTLGFADELAPSWRLHPQDPSQGDRLQAVAELRLLLQQLRQEACLGVD